MSAISLPAIIIGFLTTLIGGAGIGGILKTWLDHKRASRTQTDEVALTLVARLEGRVATLEKALEMEHARCESQLAVNRHQINNLKSMLDGLLLIWDMPPAKRAKHIENIKARRAELEQLETLEKTLVVTAPLQQPPAPIEEKTT